MKIQPFLALLPLTIACGAPPSSEVDGVSRAPIVGGMVDSQDTSVGMFYADTGNGGAYICSGEVIGPHTFLTAGHCARDFSLGSSGVIVATTDGLNPGPDAGRYLIDDAEANPAFVEQQSSAADWNDIGVLHTSNAMPGPYLVLNRYPLDRVPLAGQPVTEIGYGISDPADGGGAGTRRKNVIYDFTVRSAGEIQSGAVHGLTCNGDSGGPALLTTPDGVASVIGVVSRGDMTCSQLGIDTRVDAYLGFIKSFMVAHNDMPSCSADGRCGFDCAAPDPDCPCAPDGYCTSACATPEADPDCPQSCLYDGGTCIAAPDAGAPAPDGKKAGGGCGATGACNPALLGLLVLGAALRRRLRGQRWDVGGRAS